MRPLIESLPAYYRHSAPVAELERAIGTQMEALWEDREDLLRQLWVDTATWGLAWWESWCGLPPAPDKSLSWRRGRVLSRLRSRGTTTAELIATVVAGYGYDPSQVAVVEHPAESRFEVVLSGLAETPTELSGITTAVNEVKPAHLDWYFTFELAALLTAAAVGAGLWNIRETVLPALEG